jgi:hypothetical protein
MEDALSTPQFSLIVFEDSFATADSARAALEKDVEVFFQKFSVPYEVLWLSRRQNVQDFLRLVQDARGEYVVTLNAALTSPLGDLFKLLQGLTADPTVDFVFGERATHGKKYPRWEKVFTQALHDKKSRVLTDPFSDYVAARKRSLLKIDSSSKTRFVTAWLQKEVLTRNLKFQEIPLHETPRGKNTPRHSFFQLLWMNLFF